MKTKTTRKNNKHGISLIVLVITIIVMVILAGAIILTLNNSGIIGRASSAVEETNLATAKEVATLTWAEAYADGVRTVEDANGTKGFKSRVEEALTNAGIDLNKYKVVVTESGVEVTLKGESKAKWVKEGFTVVKGDKVLKIGELVDYDETAGGEKTGLTNVQWKVLGADEEGNLLIMSASDVKTGHGLGYDTTDTTTEAKIASAQNNWKNGAAELDGICEPYGYGEGVVGKARSITVEDVNKVTGYNPETASNGEPYGKGQVYQYGNKVTYKYNGTTTPAYESAVVSGTLSSAHSNGFYYYNEETKEFAHITDLTTGTSGNVFAELTSNYYYYYAPNLTTISATANPEAYQMIFGNNDTYYWLASPYVKTDTNYAYFGMRDVDGGGVDLYSLWDSFGDSGCLGLGVRAVVTLSSDIQFTEYTANGWSY